MGHRGNNGDDGRKRRWEWMKLLNESVTLKNICFVSVDNVWIKKRERWTKEEEEKKEWYGQNVHTQRISILFYITWRLSQVNHHQLARQWVNHQNLVKSWTRNLIFRLKLVRWTSPLNSRQLLHWWWRIKLRAETVISNLQICCTFTVFPAPLCIHYVYTASSDGKSIHRETAKASKYEESESGISVRSYASRRSVRSRVSRVSSRSNRSNVSRACSCKSGHSGFNLWPFTFLSEFSNHFMFVDILCVGHYVPSHPQCAGNPLDSSERVYCGNEICNSKNWQSLLCESALNLFCIHSEYDRIPGNLE